MNDARDTVTRLLQQVRNGDRRAFDRLFPLVYDELRRLAAQQRRRWDGDDSLNTTALVHEAYLRLAGRQSAPAWESRPHFLAVAAKAMRHILVDHAKRRRTAKRGGGLHRVDLGDIESTLRAGGDVSEASADALTALDDALRRLEAHNARQSRIVECRFFGGMPIDETAAALGVSAATVKRGWAMAQAWLYRELADVRSEAP